MIRFLPPPPLTDSPPLKYPLTCLVNIGLREGIIPYTGSTVTTCTLSAFITGADYFHHRTSNISNYTETSWKYGGVCRFSGIGFYFTEFIIMKSNRNAVNYFRAWVRNKFSLIFLDTSHLDPFFEINCVPVTGSGAGSAENKNQKYLPIVSSHH